MKEDIYTAEWFQSHYNLREEYNRVADCIADLFVFRTCIDVGCGVGFVIDRLASKGYEVAGLDGSSHARDNAPPEIRHAIQLGDIVTYDATPTQYDLVICTEVAEHMPASDANPLVSVITTLAKGSIFFTAATPGQGGNDHINEQPHEYWIGKFMALGYALDQKTTAMARLALTSACPGMHWFGKNTLVFREVTT